MLQYLWAPARSHNLVYSTRQAVSCDKSDVYFDRVNQNRPLDDVMSINEIKKPNLRNDK